MTSANPDLPPQHPIGAPADDVLPHRPADDREEVYFHGSPKMRGEIGRVLLCGIIGIALIAAPILYRTFTREGVWPIWWITLFCIIAGALVISIPWIMTKMERYRISNYRIDRESGLLSKRIDTLELWHVEDIRFEQSVLDRIFGVGTIEVISHDDTTPRLNLHSLPNPRPLFDMLKQRIISVKRQRGVVKMDIGHDHVSAG